MTKKKMVIFASGRGSNAIALHDAVEAGTINAEIKALVCDIPGAPVMDRAKEWGVPVILADRKSFDSKAAFEKYILDAIEPYQADVICLAGFMRLLSGDFISHYEHKMLNIHPALLPSFRGLHAQRQAVEAGVKIAGCTVHFVDEGMDTGPIILQRAVPVLDGDTPESLHARIQEQEHIAYPEALRRIASGRLRVNGRRVIWEGGTP